MSFYWLSNAIQHILPLQPIKYCIWDIDGTVYRNEQLAKDLRSAFVQYVSKSLRVSKNTALKKFEKEQKKQENWGKTAAALTNSSIKEIIVAVEADFDKSKYVTKNIALTQLFKNIQKNHIENIILTNSTLKQTQKILNKLGITHIEEVFSKILTIEDFLHPKPHIDNFQSVLEYTKAEPKFHLMIGDDEYSDIHPAKKLGMKTCFVYPNRYSKQANYHISSLSEIQKILKLQ